MNRASPRAHTGAEQESDTPLDGRAERAGPQGRAERGPERADDVLALSRLATRRNAVRAILDWLAHRTGGVVTLLDVDGEPAVAPAPEASAALRAAADAVVELHRRGTPSAVLTEPLAEPLTEPLTDDARQAARPPAVVAPRQTAQSGTTAGSRTVFLVSLAAGAGPGAEGGPRRPPPYLVLITPDAATETAGGATAHSTDAAPGPRAQRPHVLLADAARTLGLCWRLEEAERDRLRVATAEAHSREAVLHLLMVGSVPAAHRIAAALRPPLPQLAYVYVIECPDQRRYEVAERIEHAARGRAWIVPCPVRPTHLIALVPATSEAEPAPDEEAGAEVTAGVGRAPSAAGALPGPAAQGGDCAADLLAAYGQLPGAAHRTPPPRPGPADAPPSRPGPPRTAPSGAGRARPVAPGIRGLDRDIAERVPECVIGVSGEVPLRETPIGYEQAFHALAVARTAPSGRASFQRDSDLSPLAVEQGVRWARELLAPCVTYLPPRRADPGGDELLGTLGSWLTFGSAASRHLKIHRNTLAARVRLIGDLLELRLDRLAGQSAAWLALQLRSVPVATTARQPTPTLEALLATPAVEVWARARLRPLERANLPSGTDTVRAWLRADAKLSPAASALGISLPGARKRLTRAEEALGRSLLHAPSAKHELWLAMRALGSL
ncbi:helix-turn-helix domain-containing protein [Streptomyces sp. 796.1]|uniref:helix-turn-helix domain-containing protein n=1 Tax=Streptomyces sp. 796.1 TaxID=3163029 RepID=UPI0039C99BF0